MRPGTFDHICMRPDSAQYKHSTGVLYKGNENIEKKPKPKSNKTETKTTNRNNYGHASGIDSSS